MKPSHLAVCALLLMSTSLSAVAAVTATLERDHIESGDSVQLVLQHDGRTGKEPDLEPLKKDFDILGSSSGSSMQFTNGHFTSLVQMQITLSPKHDGTLTIPSLQWEGEKSDPLQLTVGGGSADNAAAASSPHVFIESSLDQPRPYVQGTATLTVRIYTDQQLYQGGLELNGNSDVVVQVLGKDQQSNEVRDGRHYQVIQRQYLLQPQRSGTLNLDGPQLDAQVAVADNRGAFGNDPFFANSPFAGMMRTARPLHVRGKPVVLDVRPRPASLTSSVWLPADDISLEESWKPDTLRVHVGEPLTRHLKLRAKGATGTQLPDLATLMNLPEGLKAYPDQPKLDTAAQGNSMLGTRDQDIALIAQRPGHYQLPALRLSWWDQKQDVPREAVLPARTIDILPADGSNGGAATAAPAPATETATTPPAASPGAVAINPSTTPSLATPASSSRVPWPWISLTFAVLWLATLLAWWWQFRRSRKLSSDTLPEKQDPRPDLNAVQAACCSNHPDIARRALLDWARQRWPDAPPLGLKDLAARFDDAALSTPLQELDRACYRGGEWQGDALARALGEAGSRRPRKRDAGTDLAMLYP